MNYIPDDNDTPKVDAQRRATHHAAIADALLSGGTDWQREKAHVHATLAVAYATLATA